MFRFRAKSGYKYVVIKWSLFPVAAITPFVFVPLDILQPPNLSPNITTGTALELRQRDWDSHLYASHQPAKKGDEEGKNR